MRRNEGITLAILVTGGAGYIGSHTCVELLTAGYEIIIVDNFSNSKPEVLKRIEEITGKTFRFYKVDLLEQEKLAQIFAENEIEAVVHFAGVYIKLKVPQIIIEKYPTLKYTSTCY
jgi:UDP-glucose 4-epimerase